MNLVISEGCVLFLEALLFTPEMVNHLFYSSRSESDEQIVQRVYAIGPPPEDTLCLFSQLRNVIVFPTTGKRDLGYRFMSRITPPEGSWSLPNGLGGGDLDGYEVLHLPILVNECPSKF